MVSATEDKYNSFIGYNALRKSLVKDDPNNFQFTVDLVSIVRKNYIPIAVPLTIS